MPNPTDHHEPELLTITEAAELLRAPVATLRYWRHLRTGPTASASAAASSIAATICARGSGCRTAATAFSAKTGAEPLGAVDGASTGALPVHRSTTVTFGRAPGAGRTRQGARRPSHSKSKAAKAESRAAACRTAAGTVP